LRDSLAKVTHKIFIFANPTSGSQHAANFLNYIPKKEFWVKRPTKDQSCVAEGHIFNVLDKAQRDYNYQKIKEA